MKTIGIIPSRYSSSRFPGKPLANICGKPMVWWVYQQCREAECFEAIYVATDDERVAKVCDNFSIPYIMTSKDHPTHVHRIHEVSEIIKADYYVVICGDEPLIEPDVIRAVVPDKLVNNGQIYCGGGVDILQNRQK